MPLVFVYNVKYYHILPTILQEIYTTVKRNSLSSALLNLYVFQTNTIQVKGQKKSLPDFLRPLFDSFSIFCFSSLQRWTAVL